MRLIDADAFEREIRRNIIKNDCGYFTTGQKAINDSILDCIDLLKKAPTAERSHETLESAIDYLTEIGWLPEHDRILTETRPHGEWIPCSKRLPEIRFDLNSRTSDTVFVCLENRTMHMAFYCEDDVWRFCESGEAKEPMWDKVIAWMPLPERYKKEGE